MLSGETAKGAYPKEAVTIMGQICLEAEASRFVKAMSSDIKYALKPPLSMNDAVAKCAYQPLFASPTLTLTHLESGLDPGRLDPKHGRAYENRACCRYALSASAPDFSHSFHMCTPGAAQVLALWTDLA
eukprot:4460834-Pleurochrysis_carterae.AAC.2